MTKLKPGQLGWVNYSQRMLDNFQSMIVKRRMSLSPWLTSRGSLSLSQLIPLIHMALFQDPKRVIKHSITLCLFSCSNTSSKWPPTTLCCRMVVDNQLRICILFLQLKKALASAIATSWLLNQEKLKQPLTQKSTVILVLDSKKSQ